MFALNQFFKLVKLLNSEKGAVSISAGLAMGMLLGLVPTNFLILTGLFFFFCILRINGGAMFLAWAVVKILVFPLDPLFDRFGYYLLTGIPGLQPLWTMLYNMPVVPWTRFNNSIVMGSLAVGLIAFIPAIFIFKKLIEKYRESVLKRIMQSKVWKAWSATSIYKLYEKYTSVKETFS